MVYFKRRSDGSVGIATGYVLDDLGSNPGEGEIFRTRPDLPWGPTNLLYNAYKVSFPGVRRPGYVVNHLPHLIYRQGWKNFPLCLRGLLHCDMFLHDYISNTLLTMQGRCRLPWALRRRSEDASLLGSRVRFPLRHGCSTLTFLCCVDSDFYD
jgi:hypothetical protein